MSTERVVRARVPSEICDMIIDYLHGSTETLSTCALVCKAWLPAARMHRFETLHIPRSQSRRPALALLCDNTSNILPCIRHLSLEDGWKGWKRNDPSWLDDALPRMRLRELNNLRSLTIHSLSWRALSTRARGCLLSVLPRVTSLSLPLLEGDFSLGVFEILCAATSLETLALLRPRMTDTMDQTSFLARFPAAPILRTLKRMQVDASSVLLNPIRWVNPDLLMTDLELHDVLETSAVDAASFLASCGKGVIHLSLRFNHLMFSSPEGVFIRSGGLSRNPSLLTLISLLHTRSSYPSSTKSPLHDCVRSFSI
ncbi:uncharacterized protein B0H18DRAFT_399484 [Fomitopsis serialis]|uniref:uncharacterized protein n=1 Tax=Fomitopsis serialis TaxID=139415 RepID=UPI0020079FD1|nr:uncharacterized protein B0H18DRAFT_399484 [Neoantrodia serialis]KAH9924700.1 hypothetical protein B0H18DRAFT_399484 [Neoantrodia serialis]